MRIGGWRRGAARGALLCHLLATFGFPIPARPVGTAKDGSRPFPCQSRPCGCVTYDECWKGDCCCFTIEEKLRWAEDNGIEPPHHVRPLVQSRTSRPEPPKKKSCCSEAESTPSPVPVPTCCDNRKAAPTGCAEKQRCAVETATDGPHGSSESASRGDDPKAPSKGRVTDRSGVRWVAGVYAQKCRGEGTAGLFLLDPGIAPDLTPIVPPEPERTVHPAPRSVRTEPRPHRPPTPPPRHI